MFEEGDRVRAIYGNNALQRYFDGTVIKVHEEVPLPAKNHWFAEKSIALYYLCCCSICFPKRRSYDIKYDDGRVEKQVHPKLMDVLTEPIQTRSAHV